MSQSLTLHQIEAANLPPAWECGWNHTTLQALKHQPGVWTYQQVAYPRPFEVALVLRQQARYGDEVCFHHEMAQMDGQVQIFAIPLVRWTSPARPAFTTSSPRWSNWMAARFLTRMSSPSRTAA